MWCAFWEFCEHDGAFGVRCCVAIIEEVCIGCFSDIALYPPRDSAELIENLLIIELSLL